ncbi:MAG: hypothetical protein ACREDR_13385 [Blastocatellia bacterium]
MKDETELNGKERSSRLRGYLNSVNPRTSASELVRWIARQSWITFQEKRSEPTPVLLLYEGR